VWKAITNSEFTRQYWGVEIVSDWKQGSKWQSFNTDEKHAAAVSGEILEAKPPKRLVVSWSNFADTEITEYSRVTFEIELVEDLVRLNVVHDKLKAGSETARRISQGWPRVLSSMKSLLETGKALNTWAGFERMKTATKEEAA
jgi:uncharacterized protein YndB with AHSA1/START domain